MSELDPAEIFRQEATELMEQLEVALLDLDRAPTDNALVDSAFRALHTIKGSGAMFGFDRVAAFIHDFETAFDRIRKGQARATPTLIKVALDAKDYIRLLIEKPDQANASDGSRILERLAAAAGSDAHVVEAAPAAEAAPAGPVTWRLDIAFDADILINGSKPLLLFDEIRALGTCDLVADWGNVPPLRVLNSQVSYLTWRADVTMEAPVSAFDDVFIFVRDDMRLDITRLTTHRDAGRCPSARPCI